MSHLVSPNAYRLGRTRLWGNLTGMALETLLWCSHLSLPIGFIKRSTPYVSETMYILYYPMFSIYRYRSRFLYPRFYRYLRFTSWVRSSDYKNLEEGLQAVWGRAWYRFMHRFTIRRKRGRWQDWFGRMMLRGLGSGARLPTAVSSKEWSIAGPRSRSLGQALRRLKTASYNRGPANLAYQLTRSISMKRLSRQYLESWGVRARPQLRGLIASVIYMLQLWGPRWLDKLRHESSSVTAVQTAAVSQLRSQRRKQNTPELTLRDVSTSVYEMAPSLLSEIVTKARRQITKVASMNVFQYMFVKGIIQPKNYLEHLNYMISRRTQRDQYTYPAFYDLINLLYLQTKFINIEWLFLRAIKYTLFKMHKRNVKLKYFLRFVHNIIDTLRINNQEISLMRLVVHGKIKGGTHRTNIFTAGYGKAAVNTVGSDTRYCFDNIYSKYGEYGLHLLISRRPLVMDK